MGQVSVTINGRSYPVACDDGQEEHVSRLAAYLDKRAIGLADQIGSVSEARLLIMTSLLVADELSEAYDEVEKLQQDAKAIETRAREETLNQLENVFAESINNLAVRIEYIADSLETN
tara:strand:+ start:110 stop:463 length:354 start_codon:yes stop_codon:yes gene_type:complete